MEEEQLSKLNAEQKKQLAPPPPVPPSTAFALTCHPELEAPDQGAEQWSLRRSFSLQHFQTLLHL